MTYDERLVKCEHDNKLDSQELGEWTFALQFFFRETVEK